MVQILLPSIWIRSEPPWAAVILACSISCTTCSQLCQRYASEPMASQPFIRAKLIPNRSGSSVAAQLLYLCLQELDFTFCPHECDLSQGNCTRSSLFPLLTFHLWREPRDTFNSSGVCCFKDSCGTASAATQFVSSEDVL